MATIVESRKFSLFNADARNNKFWNITLFDNGDVEVHYGPQGGVGQRKLHHNVGRSFFEKKIKEKTKPNHKGGAYVENKALDAVQSIGAPKVVSKDALAQKAIEDIGANQPELKKLIKYFASVNAHNIMEASGGKITYDTSSGTFSTTQGVISLDQIQEARRLLDEITKFAERNDFHSQAFKSVLNPYLSLIPQKGLVRQLHFPSMFSLNGGLQRQNDILDGLESSYASVIANNRRNGGNKIEETPLFKVTLTPLEKASEIDKIRKYYRSTKGTHSDVQHYDVYRCYALVIQSMADAFEKSGRAIGNIMRLWHGTKASNMLSILKAGFVLPRPGGSIQLTGAMFGPGVYFSDQSTKSIRYATGAWGGSRYDRKFMFLADVAMGRMYIPRSSFGGKPPAGYDSTFAKAKYSGVMNNEMVVYKLHQINPVFIIEFTPYGK